MGDRLSPYHTVATRAYPTYLSKSKLLVNFFQNIFCLGTVHKCDETHTTLLGVISLQLMSSLDRFKSKISMKKMLEEWNAQNSLQCNINMNFFLVWRFPTPYERLGGFSRLGPIPNFFPENLKWGAPLTVLGRQNTLSACGRNVSWEAHWMFVQGGALSLRQLPVKARWVIIFFSMSDNFFYRWVITMQSIPCPYHQLLLSHTKRWDFIHIQKARSLLFVHYSPNIMELTIVWCLHHFLGELRAKF